MEEVKPEDAERMTDRELASEMRLPEEEAEKIRKNSGVSRLEDFLSEKGTDELEIGFDLGEMHKRQIQGAVGERIASFLRNRIVEFLDEHVEDGWEIRRGCEVVSAESFARNVTLTDPVRKEIEVSGSNVKHRGKEEEEVVEHLEENCFALEPDLFQEFLEARNPCIDEIFYGFRKTGAVEKRFASQDLERAAFDSETSVEAEVPVADDFKILAVEVKTTGDRAEELLSKNQRNVREAAEESPFIDFFTLHVDLDLEEIGVPESVKSRITKQC